MLDKDVYKDKEFWNRRGTFVLTTEMMKRFPFELQLILSEVIISDADYNFCNSQIEYHGFSPHFKIVEPKTKAPRYRPMVDTIKNEEEPDCVEYKIRFEKI